MAVSRAEVIPGPRGVNRVVYERARVDAALVELEADVETAAASVRDIRGRIRYLVKDARHRELIRRRLSIHAHRVARSDLAGLTGAHLVRARFLSGISQRELAAAWGIGRSAVAEAERGRRPMPDGVGKWARQVLRLSGEWPED